MWYEHGQSSEWSHTLCRIELNESKELGDKVVKPILGIENDGERTRKMRCACLESKLYILGGELEKKRDEEGMFPTDVYVFDLNGNTQQLKKLDSKLNSGKPCPVVFSANGKIYALANLGSVPFRCPYWIRDKIDLFECYDPKIDEWRVLDDPPVYKGSLWRRWAVLPNNRKLALYGWDTTQLVVVFFDLDQEKWVGDPIVITDNEGDVGEALTLEEGDGITVYGIGSWPGIPFKSKSLVGSLVQPEFDLDIDDQRWKSHSDPVMVLRYAGYGYLYYIVSNASPDDLNQLITITLIRDLGDDPGYIKSNKILSSQTHIMETPNNSCWTELANCFLLEDPSGVDGSTI